MLKNKQGLNYEYVLVKQSSKKDENNKTETIYNKYKYIYQTDSKNYSKDFIGQYIKFWDSRFDKYRLLSEHSYNWELENW